MLHTGLLDDWTVSLKLEAVTPIGEPILRWHDGNGLQVSITGTDPPVYVVHFWNEAVARICIEQKWLEIARLSPDVPLETLDHFLIDQIFPRIISHTGKMALHAGAVEWDGQALAFLGQSGLGKSTLAASLHQQGALLISDDVLIVSCIGDQRFYGKAIYPGLRLFPDSIARLFPIEPDLTSFAHYSPKHRVALRLPAANGLAERPLAAIFFLGPQNSEEISVRPMRPAETCMGMIANSFSLDPSDPIHAQTKLMQATAIAANVPSFELSYPRQYERLADVHAAIFGQMTHYTRPVSGAPMSP